MKEVIQSFGLPVNVIQFIVSRFLFDLLDLPEPLLNSVELIL